MQADVQELRDLPLDALITAPLNAVITAQRDAAVTTMKFIEEIGYIRPDEDSFFDPPADKTKNTYDIRIAKLKVNHTKVIPPATATGTATTVPLTTEVEHRQWHRSPACGLEACGKCGHVQAKS